MSLKKVGKIWWIDFYHNGRRIRKSLGTTSKKKAQEIECRFKNKLLDEKFMEDAYYRDLLSVLSDKEITITLSGDPSLKHNVVLKENQKLSIRVTTEDSSIITPVVLQAKDGFLNIGYNKEVVKLYSSDLYEQGGV